MPYECEKKSIACMIEIMRVQRRNTYKSHREARQPVTRC